MVFYHQKMRANGFHRNCVIFSVLAARALCGQQHAGISLSSEMRVQLSQRVEVVLQSIKSVKNPVDNHVSADCRLAQTLQRHRG